MSKKPTKQQIQDILNRKKGPKQAVTKNANHQQSDSSSEDFSQYINIESYEDPSDAEDFEDYKIDGYHPTLIGESLSVGRYIVVQKLGWGHFSTVWLVQDKKKNSHFALKIQKSKKSYSESAIDELELLRDLNNHSEDEKWSQIVKEFNEKVLDGQWINQQKMSYITKKKQRIRRKHSSDSDTDQKPEKEFELKSYDAIIDPNLTFQHNFQETYCVRLVDNFPHFGVHGKHYCSVFDIMGPTLLDLISHFDHYDKKIGLWLVKIITRQILISLVYMHDVCQMIHTDLKPENIMIQLKSESLGEFIEDLKKYKKRPTSMKFLAIQQQKNGGKNKKKYLKKKNKKKAGKEPIDSTKTSETIEQNHIETEKQETKIEKDQTKIELKDAKTEVKEPKIEAREQKLEVNETKPKTKISKLETKEIDNSKQEAEISLVQSEVTKQEESEVKQMKDEIKIQDEIIKEEKKEKQDGDNKKRVKKARKGNSQKKRDEKQPEIKKEFIEDAQDDSNDDYSDVEPHEDSGSESRSHYSSSSKASSVDEETLYTLKWKEHILIKLDKELQIKIVDFGNACWTHKKFTDNIQTREYRAPEVIIGADYQANTDIWSVACIVFELITNDYLFKPKKGKGYGKSDDHLALMVETLGKINKTFAMSGNKSREFFNKNAQLINIKDLRMMPINEILMDDFDFEEKEALAIEDFLLPMLEYEPKKRISAKEALRHPWLWSF